MGSFFSSLANPLAAAAAEEGDSAVVAVHSRNGWDEQFTANKNSNKLLVIDFSAAWCGPCRMIEPAFKALASRFSGAVFVKIDVDELSAVAQQWSVEAMPTFVLVKGGKEVTRVIGVNKDELESKIARFMA